jgi:hypothetical protein
MMVLKIRATVQNGKLELIDRVPFKDGQAVEVTIQAVDDDDKAIQAALGDLVRWPNSTDDRFAEFETQADEIDRAFGQGRPLSEIIIEDRGEA